MIKSHHTKPFIRLPAALLGSENIDSVISAGGLIVMSKLDGEDGIQKFFMCR